MDINLLKSNNHKEHRFVLIALVILLVLIIGRELWVYITGLLAASTIYALVRNQMAKLVEKRKWGRSLSAITILIEVIIVFLIPISGIGLMIVNEVSGIQIDIESIKQQIIELIDRIEKMIGTELNTPDLSNTGAIITGLAQRLLSGGYSLIINSFIAIFALYFMLINYDSFEKTIYEILPFRRDNKDILKDETKNIIKATAVGIPVVAVLQGIIAYIGYTFFGIGNTVVLAILVSFTTIIPIIGTSLVWLPVGLIPILQGDYVRGALLLVYGLAIIGGSDTVFRFVLQKQIANIHPLITFFGVLMGIPIFGLWGVIFGPLLLSLLILFINMYRRDYIPGSKAEPRVTSKKEYNLRMNKLRQLKHKSRRIKKTKDTVSPFE
ncbi:MAG: AI-2E family transporter [Dysgonamonadaceae bacterium]|jgi:predicted PurR-regulated permease PerM|nr:AI-2E family transporter [Dysgonamonadaceae bacterium]MDD3308883.1 AI-2E family transporter [Dysgonamonadaceae bacterium]MEA5080709.1 AI-2E family transporter [Dysgonamonadaceae bacterium]